VFVSVSLYQYFGSKSVRGLPTEAAASLLVDKLLFAMVQRLAVERALIRYFCRVTSKNTGYFELGQNTCPSSVVHEAPLGESGQ
jgi:hypothetical protein